MLQYSIQLVLQKPNFITLATPESALRPPRLGSKSEIACPRANPMKTIDDLTVDIAVMALLTADVDVP